MRLLIGLLLFVAVGAGDVARLRDLAETRRLFLLRELLEQPGWNDADTLFCRAMVESRFGHEPDGIRDLTRYLAHHRTPGRERRADQELAAALAREGRYGEAARYLTAALRLMPASERSEHANTRDLFAALTDVPPQTVTFGDAVPLRASFSPLGSWDVPVEVNGHEGQWIFDTGANISTLSAGEAARLGLTTRVSDAYVTGSTGKKNALRLAVASDLWLGRAHLQHVVFLVLSDESLFVGPLNYQIHGILGLPVIRALGRVGIAAHGDVRIEPEATASGRPNLFFDDREAIVEVGHADRQRQMFLDTGANASLLYRSFRSALTDDEVAALRTKADRTGGVGEIIVRRTEVVPDLHLVISGRPVDLSNVSLLTTPPEGDSRYRDGVLGTDALRRGFTLDFRAMQLSIAP